jgi:hypothetical protein
MFDGLFFTELAIPDAPVKKHVRVKLGGQNRNLNDVKRAMANKQLEQGRTRSRISVTGRTAVSSHGTT